MLCSHLYKNFFVARYRFNIFISASFVQLAIFVDELNKDARTIVVQGVTSGKYAFNIRL